MLMENGLWYQLVLFGIFIALGMASALVYDTFRIVRSGFLVTALKDMLFWLVMTVLVFTICLVFNNGEIRFFMFCGILIGALTYFRTVSRYVIGLLRFLLSFFKKIFGILLKILFLPVRMLIRLLHKPVFVAITFSKKSMKKLKEKTKFKLKVFKKFKR